MQQHPQSTRVSAFAFLAAFTGFPVLHYRILKTFVPGRSLPAHCQKNRCEFKTEALSVTLIYNRSLQAINKILRDLLLLMLRPLGMKAFSRKHCLRQTIIEWLKKAMRGTSGEGPSGLLHCRRYGRP